MINEHVKDIQSHYSLRDLPNKITDIILLHKPKWLKLKTDNLNASENMGKVFGSIYYQ